jgi:peptidoglycan hydrolase-like protein with peptidoglycan-binding domain
MRSKIAVLVFFAFSALARADQTIESVQQALKDQGFYYGEVTGEKNPETTAGIRRYQIRNGLSVSGELDAETLRSLGIGATASSRPAGKSAPSPSPLTSDLRNDSSTEAITTPAPVHPFGVPPQDGQPYPSNPALAPARSGGLLAGTPYENAPPDVQHEVIVNVQKVLARRGFYRGEIDGTYGSAMEFSVRAYQARVGLSVSGRLDLETLAALELLPGARGPVFTPRRRFRPPPVVRGEWLRD